MRTVARRSCNVVEWLELPVSPTSGDVAVHGVRNLLYFRRTLLGGAASAKLAEIEGHTDPLGIGHPGADLFIVPVIALLVEARLWAALLSADVETELTAVGVVVERASCIARRGGETNVLN